MEVFLTAEEAAPYLPMKFEEPYLNGLTIKACDKLQVAERGRAYECFFEERDNGIFIQMKPPSPNNLAAVELALNRRLTP